MQKWSEIGLKEHYQSIFGPFGSGSKANNHCKLCGIESGEREIKYNSESEQNYCTFCTSFIELTNNVKDADILIIKETAPKDVQTIKTYKDVFQSFGFEYVFTKHQNINKENSKYSYLLNDTNFMKLGFKGYRFGAYQLPFYEQENRQLTFKEIAEKSIGDTKLAFLKLDVDNLGNLFFKGLGEKSTISRTTTLSRMLALYFEGYINYLISSNKWNEYLYVVFSDGDDTFIVGSWDKILDFTREFYSKFRDFTCHHPQVTFSAGICMFNYNYPIIMSSQLTEEALEKAKNFLDDDKQTPTKNRISLFGEIFNWAEFDATNNFKKLLLNIMAKNTQLNKKRDFGRAFLFKSGNLL